jgi:hypothetical protein
MTGAEALAGLAACRAKATGAPVSNNKMKKNANRRCRTGAAKDRRDIIGSPDSIFQSKAEELWAYKGEPEAATWSIYRRGYR